jgi:cyclase
MQSLETLRTFGWCPHIVMAMGAAVAFAQAPPENTPPGANSVTLETQLVKTGLYLIQGGGGNSLMRFSASGIILVDGKLSASYRALMSQVRKVGKFGDLPVRVVILTDHHEQHSGTNPQFLAAGIPVVAQDNAAKRLGPYGLREEKTQPRFVTYERVYDMRMGGVDVQLLHFGPAHTDGDAIAYFPNLKVVALGDVYTSGSPLPDYSAGGSLVGWALVLGEILKLEFDVAVPGVGPTVSRSDVIAFKTKLDTLVSRATALIEKGVTKDRLMTELRTDDLGWRFDFTAEQVDRLYADMLHSR